ncbi:MAG: sigma-70 family RNA polymerase sigma factor [Agarilytica sp.]
MTDEKPLKQVREDEWSKLLLHVGAGNEESFAKLFAHFAPLIKGFCQSNKSFLSHDSAEELVQEVMIKVWQKATNFDPSRASASTWIFTIVRNARIDYLRKHARHDVNSTPLESEDIWDEANDNQPFVFMQRNREEREVASLLSTLPPEQGRCIEKVYLEGKSHTEIAEELELPLGTVKSRVRLGLKKLQPISNLETR